VIPAYNEEYTIAKVVLKAMKHVDKVIVCDDGSTDMTGEIAERLGAIVIKHKKNLGKGYALRDLLLEAESLNPDIVITLDADDQHEADEIPLLINALIESKADIAIGSRHLKSSKTDMPRYRILGLQIINAIARRILRSDLKDTQSGFRAFTNRALHVLRNTRSDGYGVESEQITLAMKEGLKIVEVPVTIRYKGLKRTSKKNPITQAAEIITALVSLKILERPLLYLGVPGTALLAVGILFVTYLLLIFNSFRYFSIPIALITLGALIVGAILTIASLILYSIRLVKAKIQIVKGAEF